ncbi:hypothetical protein BV22DRAFT_989754, partial [Leucogyrophana mollusca]
NLRLHLFDRAGALYSCPYNIHQHPHVLIHIMCLTLTAPEDFLGYDPTILIRTLIPSSGQPARPLKSVKAAARTIIDLIRGRATSCWHVQDDKHIDYVIKDCWTNVGRATREEDLLKCAKSVRGVPKLVAAWTVEFNGAADSTSARRPAFLIDNYPKIISDMNIQVESRDHRRLLMTLVGESLAQVLSVLELVSCLIDLINGK